MQKRKPGAARPRPNMEMLKLRIERGLSREDLGRLAGVSTKTIGFIENGQTRRPREDTMLALSRALGARSPLDLFALEDRLS
jgi:DNA-binding XRE family transcriptional regulator